MSRQLRVLVKSAQNLRDTDMPGSGTADPYVKLRVVDSKGHTVAGPKETKVATDNLNPVWNEEVVFDGLETPASCTLRINLMDKDTLFGLGGSIADALAMDDRLGSADVDLGKLKKESGWQDMELAVERRMLGTFKSTLRLSVSTEGQWGN